MEDNQKPSKDVLLPGAIIVAALLIAGSLVYKTGSNAIQPPAGLTGSIGAKTADLLDPDDVVLGNPNAPVTIVEFGDYQCPFCGKFFSEVEPRIRDQYIKTGKVKMQFRDFPFLGEESNQAASASQCAAEQGKFWAYHDLLYQTEIADGRENSGNLTGALFNSLAARLGLDQAKFSTCLASGKYNNETQKDYNDGLAAGVNGTPATFINGQMISGAVPFLQFQAAIEEALAAARQ